MKKVGKIEDENQSSTSGFNLDAELSIIIKNNILPRRIVEKIGEKIKENKIKINKEQLYKLVDKIQNVIQSKNGINQNIGINTPDQKIEQISVTSSDMEKLVESIEKLKDRIKNIEENNLKDFESGKNRFVETKDIKILNKGNEVNLEEIEPLLELTNDPESVVVLMKWLQYLVDKLGKDNLPDVLSYYVDIDWISDDVRLDLIKYSKGITCDKDSIKKIPANLSTKDHIQSLLFIQKLKGQQLDDRFIWKIDREMEKMAKSLDGYQLK